MQRQTRTGMWGLLAAGALAAGCFGCATFAAAVPPPSVSFEEASLQRFDADGVAFDLVFAIVNRAPVGAALESYRLTLRVDGVGLVDDEVREELDLRPGKEGRLVVPVRLRHADVQSRLKGGALTPRLPWHAVGELRVKTATGPVRLPFDERGELDLAAASRKLPGG